MFGKKNDVAVMSKMSETDSFEKYTPGHKKDLTSEERRLLLKFTIKIIQKRMMSTTTRKSSNRL